MANQPSPAQSADAGELSGAALASESARRTFPPKGQPVIHGFNRIGLWSLYMKEVRRFLKVHTQTIWAPAVTTLLFLVIFTVALGRSGREVLGVPFATFVAPGLITSMWGEKFDHNAAITNFVVAPLSLLSGTFYVLDNLSPLFQTISRANPFFYMISGFRFGFLGQSDIGNTNQAVIGAALGLGVLNLVLGWVAYRLLKSGWKLKS